MHRIKINDTVEIIAGKDKKKTGNVLSIDYEKNKVVVQGCNVYKKAMKPRQGSGEKGQGFIDLEKPIDISNLALIDKSGKRCKIGYKSVTRDGKIIKIRVNKKTGDEI